MRDENKDISIGVIGCCWHLEPDRYEKKVASFIERLHIKGGCKHVSVWMRAPANMPKGDSWFASEGSFLDISAYERGVRELSKDLSLYLIFNDSLFVRHPYKLIARKMSSFAASVAAAPLASVAGEVHPTTPLLLKDSHNPNRRHVQTHCMLMNKSAYAVFMKLLSDLPIDDSLDGIKKWIEKYTAVYPALQLLLYVHLVRRDTPWTWRSIKQVTDLNHELVLRKSVTVVFEYLYTIELLKGGFVMPINAGGIFRLRSRLSHIGL